MPAVERVRNALADGTIGPAVVQAVIQNAYVPVFYSIVSICMRSYSFWMAYLRRLTGVTRSTVNTVINNHVHAVNNQVNGPHNQVNGPNNNQVNGPN